MESGQELSYQRKSVCNSCQKKLKERVITDVCLHKFCWDCAYEYMNKTINKERLCPVCLKQFQMAISITTPSHDQMNNAKFPIMWHRIMTDFRKKIYSKNVWVLDFANVSESDKKFTPQFYRDNPSEIKRLFFWLKREIKVLLDHCGSTASWNNVVETILAILHDHCIQSEEFKAAIQPFFERETSHFIHEFFTFSSSFCDIHTFDDMAFYSCDSDNMNQMNVYLDFQQHMVNWD